MSIAFERLKEETTKFDPHFVVGVQLVKYLEVENCKQLNLICILLSLNAIPFLEQFTETEMQMLMKQMISVYFLCL